MKKPMKTKILTTLTMLWLMSITAFAQLKGLSISGAGKTVATSGEVVASAEEIRTAAAILRAEIVQEAGADRYGDLQKRNQKGFDVLRASDAKSLEQLLPALAESLERIAKGIGVDYPGEGELKALQTAVEKIRVEGPTGPITEGQIVWAYGLAKAMLRKGLKCSNPASTPAQPQLAPAQSPATPAPTLVQPDQPPAQPTLAPPAPKQPQPASVQPQTSPTPDGAETKAKQAKRELERLRALRPTPPTPVGAAR